MASMKKSRLFIRVSVQSRTPHIPISTTMRWVYADTNFNYCIFLIFEPEGADQGSTTNLVIVAPAQNAAEGSKLIGKLKLNSVYPFNGGYLELQ